MLVIVVRFYNVTRILSTYFRNILKLKFHENTFLKHSARYDNKFTLVIVVRFYNVTKFFRHIFEITSNVKFHENSFSESRVVQCGRADVTTPTVPLRNSANAPKKMKRKTLCKQISTQGSQAGTTKAGSDAVRSRRKCCTTFQRITLRRTQPGSSLNQWYRSTKLYGATPCHSAPLFVPYACPYPTRTASIFIRNSTHINSQQTAVISAKLTRNSKLEDIQIQR